MVDRPIEPTAPAAAWALVPTEPTREMLNAAFNLFELPDIEGYASGNDARRAIYLAMVRAAPVHTEATPAEPAEALDGGSEQMVWRACVHASLDYQARDRVIEAWRRIYAKASTPAEAPETLSPADEGCVLRLCPKHEHLKSFTWRATVTSPLRVRCPICEPQP